MGACFGVSGGRLEVCNGRLGSVKLGEDKREIDQKMSDLEHCAALWVGHGCETGKSLGALDGTPLLDLQMGALGRTWV